MLLNLLWLFIQAIPEPHNDKMLMYFGIGLCVDTLAQLEYVIRAVARQRVHPFVGQSFYFFSPSPVLYQYTVPVGVDVRDVNLNRNNTFLNFGGIPRREDYDDVLQFAVPRSVTAISCSPIDLSRDGGSEGAAFKQRNNVALNLFRCPCHTEIPSCFKNCGTSLSARISALSRTSYPLSLTNAA